MFDEVMNPYWTFCFFIFGALFGSFANVAILRIPKDESVVTPSSHCYSCKKNIRFYDNIPILSWLILKGKCRHCGVKFSFRYCLVEILTGFLFAIAFMKLGFSWFLLEVLVLLLGLVIVSFIDLDHFIIPDKISLPGIALGLLGGLLNPERAFMDSLLGMLLGGGFLWAVAYVYYLIKKEEGMGGGDIKLLAWIGAVLGWMSVPFIILGSSILGSIVGIMLIAKAKGNLKTVIPFGPYIALAAVIYIAGGDVIAKWYLNLFFPWL